MRVQQLIETSVPQNRAAFSTRQECVKDGTKTLVALERLRSD